MSDLKRITNAAIKFRDERDWAKFHTPKDLAISLTLEAGEVMEHFQWKSEKEIKEYVKTHKAEIGDELADVLHNLLTLADTVGIDIAEVSERKLKQNGIKYPVEKARGKATKYNKL